MTIPMTTQGLYSHAGCPNTAPIGCLFPSAFELRFLLQGLALPYKLHMFSL